MVKPEPAVRPHRATLGACNARLSTVAVLRAARVWQALSIDNREGFRVVRCRIRDRYASDVLQNKARTGTPRSKLIAGRAAASAA